MARYYTFCPEDLLFKTVKCPRWHAVGTIIASIPLCSLKIYILILSAVLIALTSACHSDSVAFYRRWASSLQVRCSIPGWFLYFTINLYSHRLQRFVDERVTRKVCIIKCGFILNRTCTRSGLEGARDYWALSTLMCERVAHKYTVSLPFILFSV